MGVRKPAAAVLVAAWLLWLTCLPSVVVAQCTSSVPVEDQNFGIRFDSGPVTINTTDSKGVTKRTRKYCFELTNNALRGPDNQPCDPQQTQCCNTALLKLANIYVKTSDTCTADSKLLRAFRAVTWSLNGVTVKGALVTFKGPPPRQGVQGHNAQVVLVSCFLDPLHDDHRADGRHCKDQPLPEAGAALPG